MVTDWAEIFNESVIIAKTKLSDNYVVIYLNV